MSCKNSVFRMKIMTVLNPISLSYYMSGHLKDYDLKSYSFLLKLSVPDSLKKNFFGNKILVPDAHVSTMYPFNVQRLETTYLLGRGPSLASWTSIKKLRPGTGREEEGRSSGGHRQQEWKCIHDQVRT